jgi:hypothetical protein
MESRDNKKKNTVLKLKIPHIFTFLTLLLHNFRLIPKAKQMLSQYLKMLYIAHWTETVRGICYVQMKNIEKGGKYNFVNGTK